MVRARGASSPVHDYFIATQKRFEAMAGLFRHGAEAGTVAQIAGPRETAVHFRSVLELRFHEHARTSEARPFAFLRQRLLQGAVAPRALAPGTSSFPGPVKPLFP